MKLFSAIIDKNQGFSQPEPIPGLPGWTVYKEQQSEIYKIKHNLNHSLHVVATAMESNSLVIVESTMTEQFTLSTWRADNNAPKAVKFTFVAVEHEHPPHPPSVHL